MNVICAPGFSLKDAVDNLSASAAFAADSEGSRRASTAAASTEVLAGPAVEIDVSASATVAAAPVPYHSHHLRRRHPGRFHPCRPA